MTAKNSWRPNAEEDLLLKSGKEQEEESSGSREDMMGSYHRLGSNGTRRRVHESHDPTAATEFDGIQVLQSSSDDEADQGWAGENGKRISPGRMSERNSGTGRESRSDGGRRVVVRSLVTKHPRTCARCISLASSEEDRDSSSSHAGDDAFEKLSSDSEGEKLILRLTDKERGSSLASSEQKYLGKKCHKPVTRRSDHASGSSSVASSTPASKYTLTSSEGVRYQWKAMKNRENKKTEDGSNSCLKQLVNPSTEPKTSHVVNDVWNTSAELVLTASKVVITTPERCQKARHQEETGRDVQYIDLPQQEVCIHWNPPIVAALIHSPVRCEEDHQMHRDHINHSLNRRNNENERSTRCPTSEFTAAFEYPECVQTEDERESLLQRSSESEDLEALADYLFSASAEERG